MRALRASILLLCLVVLGAGCAGLGEDEGEPAASQPTQTTAENIRTAVFERSYSECSTYPVTRLATKYKVDPKVDPVSRAVAQSWTRRLGGGADVVSVGVQGCIAGFNDPVGNPA